MVEIDNTPVQTPFGPKSSCPSAVQGKEQREEWIRIQKNTFTKWANLYLERKGLKIEDLFGDLKDGLVLISLLEVIGNEQVVAKFNKSPKLRIQKLENLNSTFEYLRGKGLKLTNIGSGDILDGNNKLVLGLLWTIILRFEVADIDIDGVSGKEGLLLWCKRALKDYPGVRMENFTTSWKDGLAFCGLVHRFRPDLLNFSSLSAANAKANLDLAFKTIEDHLGIPQLLESDDIVNAPRPDEKSIVTYVSQLFNLFAAGMQKNKAVTTVCKAVDITRRHDKWRAQYIAGANLLNLWLDASIERFGTLGTFSSLSQVKDAFDKLNHYKRSEKPPQEAEQVNLDSVVSTLKASCRTNNRPQVDFALSPAALAEKWNVLLEKEAAYESHLRSSFEKFQKMDFEIQKFAVGASKLETWTKEKLAFFSSTDEASLGSTSAVQARLDSFSAIQTQQLPRYEQILQNLTEICAGLSDEHCDTAETKAWLETLRTFMKEVSSASSTFHATLQSCLARQQELDALEKECTSSVLPLVYDLEEVEESFSEPFIASNVQAVQAVVSKFERSESNVEGLAQRMQQLVHDVQILQDAGRIVTFPDTNLDQLRGRVRDVQDQRAVRGRELQDALEDAQRQETLCRQFADLATSFKDTCAEKTREAENVTGETLEDQLETVRQQFVQYKMTKPRRNSVVRRVSMEALQNMNSAEVCEVRKVLGGLGEALVKLETVNAAMEREKVFVNPFTTDTIQSLRALWTALGDVYTAKIENLSSQIDLQKVGNLTPEQLAEIKEVFDHFDEDSDGVVNEEEFIKACKGIGLSMDDDAYKATLAALDTNGDGTLDFQEFSRWCASKLESGSSKGEVIGAWEELSHGNKFEIKEEEIRGAFLEGDYATYLVENMPQAGGERSFDFITFTDDIFSR